MTADNFSFYLQNRVFQKSQTGGQWYSDTSPFSIPWLKAILKIMNGIKNRSAAVALMIEHSTYKLQKGAWH
jgi:hypothetical protein